MIDGYYLRNHPSSEFGTIASTSAAYPWKVTRAALQAYLETTAGLANPHSLPAMAVPPTIAIGAGAPTAPAAPYDGLTQAYRYSAGTLDDVSRFEGGGDAAYSTDYRRFPVAKIAAAGGNIGNGEDGVVWRATVVADAAAVAWRVLGGLFNYRFIVDGEYASFEPTNPATGGRQYVVLDFGAKAPRTITIEGGAAAALDGVHIAPGDALTLPAAPAFKALALGDSFTASIGAGGGKEGDGVMQVAADYLGIPIWSSGSGGTGYVATQDGTRYKLGDRLLTEISRFKAIEGGAPDFVIVAMSINDIGLSGIADEAGACFDAIRQECLAAMVMVVGPWNAAAPAAPSADYSAAKAAIQSAIAGRGGFIFIDAAEQAYEKLGGGDETHPSNAGHIALGQWLAGQVRLAV